MRYLKTYELFDFLKKSKLPKTWQDKFDEVYKIYLDNKNRDLLYFQSNPISLLSLPSADISDNYFSVSMGLKNHIVFYGNTGGNRNMEVIDFEEADYSNPKSNKGIYPLSEEEYKKYLSKCQEISDWLDKISDSKKNKSMSYIGNSGLELDFDESDLAIDELNDKIKSQLPIGKEFEFELSYHVWQSESKNILVVERRNLKISDIKIGFGGRFYMEIFTSDPFGKKASMWIESDTLSDYYDLDEKKWPYRDVKLIRMNTIITEMSRREKREFDKNIKYPYSFSYQISPSKYDSIEFIKNITELLSELNKMNKNND